VKGQWTSAAHTQGSLQDLAVRLVLVEVTHKVGVESVGLLQQNVDELLHLLVVLCRQAGDLDPLEIQLTMCHDQGNEGHIEGYQSKELAKNKKMSKNSLEGATAKTGQRRSKVVSNSGAVRP
jgi:hypothetical protein